jgi:hypothetical protein
MLAMSRHPDRGTNVTMIAGWLFADLALSLAIVMLVTALDTPRSPVRSPAASGGPLVSPTPEQPGVERTAVSFSVESNADALLAGNAGERSRVRRAIARCTGQLVRQQRRAAFVITFGTSGSPGEGIRLARVGNGLLRQAAGSVVDQTTATRDFWQATGSAGAARGTLTFELYLFVSGMPLAGACRT